MRAPTRRRSASSSSRSRSAGDGAHRQRPFRQLERRARVGRGLGGDAERARPSSARPRVAPALLVRGAPPPGPCLVERGHGGDEVLDVLGVDIVPGGALPSLERAREARRRRPSTSCTRTPQSPNSSSRSRRSSPSVARRRPRHRRRSGGRAARPPGAGAGRPPRAPASTPLERARGGPGDGARRARPPPRPTATTTRATAAATSGLVSRQRLLVPQVGLVRALARGAQLDALLGPHRLGRGAQVGLGRPGPRPRPWRCRGSPRAAARRRRSGPRPGASCWSRRSASATAPSASARVEDAARSSWVCWRSRPTRSSASSGSATARRMAAVCSMSAVSAASSWPSRSAASCRASSVSARATRARVPLSRWSTTSRSSSTPLTGWALKPGAEEPRRPARDRRRGRS